MNLRLFLLPFFTVTFFGCASTPPVSLTDGGQSDVGRDAYGVLYSVAPELRRVHLELINDASLAPPTGELHAEFRYWDDPRVRSRVLILHRSSSRDDSTARVTLESGLARWYFEPFPRGGGQERWKILERRPYKKRSA